MEFNSTDPRVPRAHKIAVDLVREIIAGFRAKGRRVPYVQEYIDDIERGEGRRLLDERAAPMWSFPLCSHATVWRDLCQLNGINAFAATNLGWLHFPGGPPGPGWTCQECKHKNEEDVLFCFGCRAAGSEADLDSTATVSALWRFYDRDIEAVAKRHGRSPVVIEAHLHTAGLL